MKKYFTLIIFTLLFFSSEIHSQWYQQYVDANISIEDIRFINSDTGWLCGADLIYKTTNGGKNWVNQSNQINRIIRQIHPVNDRVVYACGFYNILKTEDGGENWITLREGTNLVPILNGLWFHDENTGWFCGDVAVMRTTDGGKTFIDSMRVDGLLHDIHFQNSLTGIMCGSVQGNILRTTDSGSNWYQVPLPSYFGTYVYRESFVKNYGWLASSANIVYKTTNYGMSWDSISKIPRHPSFGQTFCIEFSSELTGYSGGDSGKIHKSTNGGLTWYEMQTLQFGIYGFLSIYAFNDSVVWAAGGGGKILYTENGGENLVNIFQNNSWESVDYILYQNSPNPFNPMTNIKYQIINSNFVELKVYNILGNEVEILVNEKQNTGVYSVMFDARNYSSGIYFYKIKIKNFTDTKRMIVLK